MKPAISGLTGSTLAQTLPSARVSSSAQTKPTKPFQTIDLPGTNTVSQPQIPQAVTSLNPSDRLQSLDANSILKKLDAQDAGSNSTNDFTQDLNRFKRSYASGQPAVANLKSTSTRSPSLDQTENRNLADTGPGTIVDVLV